MIKQGLILFNNETPEFISKSEESMDMHIIEHSLLGNKNIHVMDLYSVEIVKFNQKEFNQFIKAYENSMGITDFIDLIRNNKQYEDLVNYITNHNNYDLINNERRVFELFYNFDPKNVENFIKIV